MVAEPGELYNLVNDPREQRDLAAQEPERLREMAELLARIRREPDNGIRK
jgi:arylsulfatase A-like enzyme